MLGKLYFNMLTFLLNQRKIRKGNLVEHSIITETDIPVKVIHRRLPIC